MKTSHGNRTCCHKALTGHEGRTSGQKRHNIRHSRFVRTDCRRNEHPLNDKIRRSFQTVEGPRNITLELLELGKDQPETDRSEGVTDYVQ